MVSSEREVNVSNFSTLKTYHAESLQRLGLNPRAIDLLSIITTDWVDGVKTPAAIFRRNHRRDSSLLRSLEEKRFISTQRSQYYEPQFDAFCAILAARKRVADRIFREMRKIIREVLKLMTADPLTTQYPYCDFSTAIAQTSETVPALLLLSSTNLGIYYNAFPENESIQISEDVFKAKNLLSYVSKNLTMIANNNMHVPTAHYAASSEIGTFSLANLELVAEAHKHASRAMKNHQIAPDVAISAAKSTLEASLKFIAHSEGVVVSPSVKLPELFKVCRNYCGLGSNASHKMGRSIASLCTEVAEVRNLLGDSHGKLPGAPSPTRSEARFVVGIALQLTDCLLERYEAFKMTSKDGN